MSGRRSSKPHSSKQRKRYSSDDDDDGGNIDEKRGLRIRRRMRSCFTNSPRSGSNDSASRTFGHSDTTRKRDRDPNEPDNDENNNKGNSHHRSSRHRSKRSHFSSSRSLSSDSNHVGKKYSKTQDKDDEQKAKREKEDRRRNRKRSGWDETPLDEMGDNAMNDLMLNNELNGDSDSQERQQQAANIAVLMQTKASLSQLCRIYVGSLDYTLGESDIRSVFSAFGTIVNIDMPKEGARSKGFCFVEYISPEAAQMALTSMQGFVLKGRSIKVGRPTALGGMASTALGLLSLGTTPNNTIPIGGVIPLDESLRMSGEISAQTTAPVPPGVDISAAQAGILAATSFLAAKQAKSNSDKLSNTITNDNNETQSQDSLTPPHPNSSSSPPTTTGQVKPPPFPVASGLMHPSNTTPNRVYIGNIPYTFTSEDVRQIFQVFGSIINCQLIPSVDRPGTHRGYGFIEFQMEDQAKLAIETMNGFELGGKNLRVNHATAFKGPPSAGTSSQQPSSQDHIRPSNETYMSPSYPPASTLIVLKNMAAPNNPDDSIREEMFEECRKFGTVHNVFVHNESQTDVRIFVTYSAVEDAGNAVQGLHGRFYEGRTISCQHYRIEDFIQGKYNL